MTAEEREWSVWAAAEDARWQEHRAHEIKVAAEEHRVAVEAYNEDVEQPTKPCVMDYCDGLGRINVHEANDELCAYCSMIESGIDSAGEPD